MRDVGVRLVAAPLCVFLEAVTADMAPSLVLDPLLQTLAVGGG